MCLYFLKGRSGGTWKGERIPDVDYWNRKKPFNKKKLTIIRSWKKVEIQLRVSVGKEIGSREFVYWTNFVDMLTNA